SIGCGRQKGVTVITKERWKYEQLFAYLHILKTVLLTDTPKQILLAAFLHFPRQQKLIQDEVCLLEIEDDIKFADVAVVFVHLLDKAVHDLEGDQLVVGGGASCN